MEEISLVTPTLDMLKFNWTMGNYWDSNLMIKTYSDTEVIYQLWALEFIPLWIECIFKVCPSNMVKFENHCFHLLKYLQIKFYTIGHDISCKHK